MKENLIHYRTSVCNINYHKKANDAYIEVAKELDRTLTDMEAIGPVVRRMNEEQIYG